MTLMHPPWHALLNLEFKPQGHRTVLSHRQHQGPLRVQKALWPDSNGACHVIIVHPPAGIAGGDQLKINVELKAKSHALLTTPGAGKWYGSNERQASAHIKLKVGAEALLEWLPQETMLFNQAYVSSSTHITLDPSASFIGWDILVIGRQSRHEQFSEGLYQNRVQIYQPALILDDSLNFSGNDRWLTSPLGMAGQSVNGTMWAQPPSFMRSAAILNAQIEQIRDLIVRMKMPLVITRLDTLLVARYLGEDARQALDGFAAIRAKLRQLWFSLPEDFPRIWRT